MLLTMIPFPLIFFPCIPCKYSITMFFVVNIIPFIRFTIWPNCFSITYFLINILLNHSFYYSTNCPHIFSHHAKYIFLGLISHYQQNLLHKHFYQQTITFPYQSFYQIDNILHIVDHQAKFQLLSHAINHLTIHLNMLHLINFFIFISNTCMLI